MPCFHNLILFSYTNTDTSLSCWYPELIDLNKQACSFWHLFSSFQLLVAFSRIIFLFDNLALTLDGSDIWHNFDISVALYILHSVPKHRILICLKDSFSKLFLAFVLSSVFISSYGFNHAFWLNSSTFPANIRLDEDVLKTPWIRLSFLSSEDVFKTSSRRPHQDEYVLFSLPSSEDVFKRSSRRLGQDQHICLGYTSSRRLQDVFKTSSRRLQDVLEDVKLLRWRLVENVFKTCLQDVFKTSWRPTNACWVAYFVYYYPKT